LSGVLAGCNFSANEEEEQPKKPTLGSPIAWATARTATLTPVPGTLTETIIPTATQTPSATPTFTETPTGIPTFTETVMPPTQEQVTLPTLTEPPTFTMTPPPTFTPVTLMPTATVTPLLMPTVTPTHTPTSTPFVVVGPPTTAVVVPTYTFVPPPTFTPMIPTLTPTLTETVAVSAAVCPSCSFLRLRASAGTAGEIVGELTANTPMMIIGRVTDNSWVQIVLNDGRTGWVASQYLVINIDLNVVSVTGTVQNSSAAIPVVESDVISGVSWTSRNIFLDGLAKGNRPHVFTKVGDSISAAPQFLTQIGRGIYNLGDYGYLGTAINFFSGPNGRGANPFSATSMAARNGWSTESVLNVANSNPNVCRSGETPLECEYRLVQPAVALIMFGTNDSGGMPTATFQANLQRIVNISIDMGVIPVLSTIPPKHFNSATDGRVAEFNQVIVATARAYDVPLWDYWSAMRRLPSEGLSADGVHPSIPPDGINTNFAGTNLNYGYPMRNLGALEMLYTLWQQVLYDADTAVPATAVPSASVPPPDSSGPVAPDVDYSCPGAPPIRLLVGQPGRVTPGAANNMRDIPSTGGAKVGSIPGEAVFDVVGGPQCADGYTWWRVSYQGTTGWTANGAGDEYWVEPLP
jgi:uncharacterized protein YraI